jgi:phosphatidylglycerophosphate synthase
MDQSWFESLGLTSSQENWLGFFTLCASIAVFGIFYVSDKRILSIARCSKYITPSTISLVHVPVMWLGFIIYAVCHSMPQYAWIGIAIVTIGAVLDTYDGRLARAIGKEPVEPDNFRDAVMAKGMTRWGAVIDPCCDKAAYMPIYVYVAWECIDWGLNSRLPPYDALLLLGAFFIVAIICIDAKGTYDRLKAFDPKATEAEEPKKKLKATNWGKAKSVFQLVFLLIYAGIDNGAAKGLEGVWSVTTNVFLILIVFLAVKSVLSRRRKRQVAQQGGSAT